MNKYLIFLFYFLISTLSFGQEENELQRLNSEGIALFNESDYKGAAQKWEHGLQIARESENKKYIAGFTGNLGNVYVSLGDYSKAVVHFEEALDINREIDNKEGITRSLINFGRVYEVLGYYWEAITHYEEAVRRYREMGNKIQVATGLAGLGNVYSFLGDYAKAKDFYEEALEIDRHIGSRKGAGKNLNNLGNIYYHLGDYAKAITHYQESLKISREIGDKIGIGNDLNNMGSTYVNLGDYTKAIAFLEDAQKIYRDIGVSSEITELNIADIWLKSGDIEKAEETYKRLGSNFRLGILNLIKRKYHEALPLFTHSLQRDFKERKATSLFADHTALGQTYEFLLKDSLAFAHYQQAIDINETQWEALEENEKSRFLAARHLSIKRIAPYEGQVRVLVALKKLNEAFFYSENLKARVLTEAMARQHRLQETVLPANWVSLEDSLITRIRGLRREMEALYKTNTMELYTEREAQLQQVKARQRAFIRQLRASYPEYASVHYPQAIYPSEVLLQPDEALIAYEVTDFATYVFLLQKDSLQIRRIVISRDAMETHIRNYRGYFVGIQNTDQLIGYDPKDGHELYSLLFGNLLEDIPKDTRLIIVPDEILGILPFETLVIDLPEEETICIGEHGPYPAGVTYLADRFTISYAQSATSLTILRTLRKEDARGKYMFVMADPVFDEKDDRIQMVAQKETEVEENEAVQEAISDWKTLNLCGPGLLKENTAEADTAHTVFFNRLPETSELAKKLAKVFVNKTQVLEGKWAREDYIYIYPVSQFRYLTFATHGILDKTIPYIQEPALVLNQVSTSDTCDGFFTMSEVMGLSLQADVVALTACETGLGENVSGEGVMGMGRAFQYAGARNVFVSLWSVAEASSTELTLAFFQHINNGKEPVDAIQLARQEVRRQGYEHPFYWGAFILYGE